MHQSEGTLIVPLCGIFEFGSFQSLAIVRFHDALGDFKAKKQQQQLQQQHQHLADSESINRHLVVIP